MSIEFLNAICIALTRIGSDVTLLILGTFTLSILQKLFIFNVTTIFGRNGIVITGVVGVTLHETSHFLMCMLFGVKVKSVKLFTPSSLAQLGYVQYSYNRNSLIQSVGHFFIGYAPFILSFVFIWSITLYLLGIDLLIVTLTQGEGGFYLWSELLHQIREQIFSGAIWLFCFISVFLHMMPSEADLRGARMGEGALLIIIILTLLVEFFALGHMNQVTLAVTQTLQLLTKFVVSFIVIVIALNVAGCLFSVSVLGIRKWCGSKIVETTPQF